MDPLEFLFSFRGRIGRIAFLAIGFVQLGLTILLFVLSAVLTAGSTPASIAADGSLGLAALWVGGAVLFAWMGLAGTVRRWHDRDKSAWWMLLNAVPIIGPLWTVIELSLLPGTDGVNRWGPPPSAGSAARYHDDYRAADGATTPKDVEAIVSRWAAANTGPRTAAAGRTGRPVVARLSGPAAGGFAGGGAAGGFGRRGLK